MMKIERGLFGGTEIPADQMMPVRDDAGQVRLKPDGSPMLFWPTTYRTPIFLDKFSPLDGWQVTVESSIGEFTIPDKFLNAEGNVVQQPTVAFKARLKSKEGLIAAEASCLATIWGSKAWELGETIARGRLYDALGLSAPFAYEPIPQPEATPIGTTSSGSAGTGPVPTVDVEAKADAVPAQAEPQPAIAAVASTDAVAPQVVPVALSGGHDQPVVVPTVVIDPNLLRTIANQAAARGVKVPAFANVAEAKDFYKKLLKAPSTLAGAA